MSETNLDIGRFVKRNENKYFFERELYREITFLHYIYWKEHLDGENAIPFVSSSNEDQIIPLA